MMLVRGIESDAERSVRIATSPEGLVAIQNPSCAAAIWHREPLASFQAWVDHVPAHKLPTTRSVLQPGAVRRAMYELCQASGLPECEHRNLLVDDVSALAAMFSELMRVEYLRLRLDLVTTNACRKFHVDAVTTRLVCTYRGTGTQYGVSDNGDDPECILTVGTGSPILLRGTLSPEVPRSGLLHRSPPIEGTGETRLVLVLDPVTALGAPAQPHTIH